MFVFMSDLVFPFSLAFANLSLGFGWELFSVYGVFYKLLFFRINYDKTKYFGWLCFGIWITCLSTGVMKF